MTAYSVEDAKVGLPELIDRALDGEEVIITRRGRAAVEIRPTRTIQSQAGATLYDWLRSRRLGRKSISLTSVVLLNELYEAR